MIDITKIRGEFPILSQKINGNNLVYFDNGATTQKPTSVIESIKGYYTNENSNVHRGAHFLSSLATEKLESTRRAVHKLINSKHVYEIIFTKGTTDSINLVANSFQKFLSKGDEVLISELEHHSNIVPWQLCCEKTGATLKVIPVLPNGELNLKQLSSLLNKKTKIVAISHISNTLGTINPIKKIISQCHSVGAKVLIDGAQAASHLALDVQEINADFYCFSAHKMYGPTGLGVLYGKEKLLNKMPPYQGGGEMISDVSFSKTKYAELPYKFEAGTPNIGGIIAFKAAIEFICKVGLNNICLHEKALLKYATSEILKIKNVKIYGTSNEKSAIISFNINGLHPYDIGLLLDKMGIAIRTGHHCTQPIMDKFKIPGTARLSLAVYNTKQEIDVFILSLKKVIKMLS